MKVSTTMGITQKPCLDSDACVGNQKKEMKENNKMAVKFEMGSGTCVCVSESMCVKPSANKDKQRLNRD